MNNNMNILGNIEVTVSRQDLLRAIKKNAEIAAAEYEKAKKVYELDLKKRATEALERILNGTYKGDVSYNFGLVEPVDTQQKYKELVEIFSTVRGKGDETLIAMTLQQSNCILNDEWDWASSAKTSNLFYSSRLK